MDVRVAPVAGRQAASDARLAMAVATASALALAAFVLMPHAAGPDWAPPAGFDVVWLLGAEVAVLLAPVAAGLAGWSSLVALWAHGDRLPARARRTHLVTLVVVAGYAVGLTTAWGVGAFAWFGD